MLRTLICTPNLFLAVIQTTHGTLISGDLRRYTVTFGEHIRYCRMTQCRYRITIVIVTSSALYHHPTR